LDKNQIVKSNQVIEASYQLSAVEQRIVLAAISRIPKSQPITDDELYPVSVNELQLLGVHEKTAYRDLKKVLIDFMKDLLILVLMINL
jgi:hypothetical protein